MRLRIASNIAILPLMTAMYVSGLLRALADEKALFRLAFYLLREVSSSIPAQG
jgi:hypothetical protein